MEKFGIGGDELTLALRDEEAQLMQKVASFMSSSEKTAAEAEDYRRAESRLQQVRAKLTEIDMKNKPTFG